VLLLSEKQHRGSAKCSCKIVVGSLVTYDYDAYGNLIHATGTTSNNYLFAGEQFDPDLGILLQTEFPTSLGSIRDGQKWPTH
jgi:hypothetical protein